MSKSVSFNLENSQESIIPNYLTLNKAGSQELITPISIQSNKSKKWFYFVLACLLSYVTIIYYPRYNPYDEMRVITKPSPSEVEDDILFQFDSKAEIDLDSQPNMCPKIKYLILKMIDLYECHPTEKHYLIYSEDAKFEDPLCDAKDKIEVKTQFNAMPKVFEQAKVVRAKVVSIKDKKDAIVEVQLELWQLYSVMGKLVPMKSLVILDIDTSQSKITRHLDLWNYEAAWFNKNLLVKFIWNGLRRLNGKLLPLIA